MDTQKTTNLWHLFPVDKANKRDEAYKLDTFLRGGLWCATLGSIIPFAGDIEENQPLGAFVSCWHRSAGDPTSHAWETFGGSENGIALRARPATLQAIAARTSGRGFATRFGDVTYVSSGEKPADPAFCVIGYRECEDEARLAVCFPGFERLRDRTRRARIGKSVPVTCADRDAICAYRDVTFVDDFDREAIVLPVSPNELIEEIVIGRKVSSGGRRSLRMSLAGPGIEARIRA
jgi:hypothetical protein